jgi:hypothetical protein
MGLVMESGFIPMNPGLGWFFHPVGVVFPKVFVGECSGKGELK